jgi:hypothetical protein
MFDAILREYMLMDNNDFLSNPTVAAKTLYYFGRWLFVNKFTNQSLRYNFWLLNLSESIMIFMIFYQQNIQISGIINVKSKVPSIKIIKIWLIYTKYHNAQADKAQ